MDPVSHSKRLKAGIFVFTLALCALAVSNLISQWKSEMVTDGVRWTFSEGHLSAGSISIGSPGANAGIRPGDVLQSINLIPVRFPQDVGKILNDPAHAGKAFQYDVLQGSEAFVKLVTPVRKQNTFSYYLALVGFVILAIGVIAFLKSRSRSFALHFYFLCLMFFGTYAFSYTGKLDTLDWVYYWADSAFLLFLPPVFLHFALYFPEKKDSFPKDKIFWFYVPSIFLLTARIVVTLLYYFQPGNPIVPTVRGYEAFENIELFYVFSGILAGVIMLFLSYARTDDVIQRKQLKLVLAGMVAGFGPFCLLWLVSLVVRLPQQALEASLIPQILIPLSLMYALFKYRLMDVDIIIKRGMIYTVTTLVLFFMYLLLTVSWVQFIFPEATRTNLAAIASITTMLAALLFVPLRDRVRALVDRFYYRDSYDYRRTLVQFSRQITSSLDMEHLALTALGHIRSTFRVAGVDLFLKVGLNSYESYIDSEVQMNPGLGMLSRLTRESCVLVDFPLVPDSELRDEEDVLQKMGYNYYIPCKFQRNIVAILTLTKKDNGDYLSSEDVELLITLANQLAIVIENHHLFYSLKNKADELERLKNFNENILLSLNVGIATLDENGRVVANNQYLEAYLGKDRTQMLGRSIEDLFPQQVVDRYHNYSQKSAKKKLEGARFFKTLVEIHQGKERVVNLSFVPLINESDIEYGTIVILDDVTHQSKLEEQLTQSEKLSALGLLAAGVAHEVNTPLTGISSYTQMLQNQINGDEESRDILKKIEQQTFRASKIIHTLLDLSRQQAEPFRPIDINVLLKETLALLRPHFQNHPVEIVEEFDSGHPMVSGNAGKLQQVFTNLFLNAKDAMPQGGRLLIRSEMEGGEVVIDVVDTGQGIPSDHLKRIYEPFFTTKKSQNVKGTGLGLAISYTIIQEHKGTIDVNSDAGKGTHFQIRLPKVKKEVHEQTRAYSGD